MENVFGRENVLAHQSSSTVIFPGKRTLEFGPVAESIYKKKTQFDAWLIKRHNDGNEINNLDDEARVY